MAHAGLSGLSVLRHFSDLFDYLFCLIASGVLVSLPLAGGALFLLFAVTGTAVSVFRRPAFKELPRAFRVSGRFLVVLTALASLGLLATYPLSVDLPKLWLVFGIVMLVSLRSLSAKRLCAYGHSRALKDVQILLRLVELGAVFLLLAAILLFASLSTGTAWYLLGGFALSTVSEVYALTNTPMEGGRVLSPEDSRRSIPSLADVTAFKAFALVSAITVAALQVTMIVMFTYIASGAGELLASMGIALGFALLAVQVTRWLLRLSERSARDPANIMLLGLFIWLFSLLAFGLHLLRRDSLWPYAALAACTAGSAVTFSALQALQMQMPAVLTFATGEDPGLSLITLQGTLLKYAVMVGRVITLAVLSLMLLYAGSPAGDAMRFQPVLLIPAGTLVCAALLAAFRFPLEKRYTEKLRAFLMLRENGETNAPLQQQLEDVIIRVRRRRYGIKLLMLALRPFFRSQVVGADTVHLKEGVSTVFACNHGELYGPVVAYLYIPFPFRPWSINETVDRAKVADYLYTNTFQWQAWLPKRLHRPLAQLSAPVLSWIMHSVDSIPVHRGNPRALMETFRETCAAMEAGDNILLFPENPNDPSLEGPGYLREGVGPFFTGFVTAGQMYYQRTGKCARFFPLFADKTHKTLTFGTATDYDPDRPPAVEKQRIVDHLRAEMLRMAGDMESGPAEGCGGETEGAS